jgi:hypothetical protein
MEFNRFLPEKPCQTGTLAKKYYLSYVPPDASKSPVHEVEVKPAPKEKFELAYARKYAWNP